MSKKTTKKTPKIETKDVYPMRINKYLAHKGVETRTGVDQLIIAGKVLINGKIAVLGDKVLEKDKVIVRGVHNKKKYLYLAYNKPKGLVSTNPQGDEISVMENIKEKVFPVGRLDKESHGLLILTNDGRITDRLLNPIYEHEKECLVKVDRKFTPGFLRNMQDGVVLDGEMTKPSKVAGVRDDVFKITLTEGKNRQIRRMTEKLGYTVRDLQRIRVQNIKINNIPINSYREILGDEQKDFLKSIGLS
jgi:23S rRNA pseudouridine2604 synthase